MRRRITEHGQRGLACELRCYLARRMPASEHPTLKWHSIRTIYRTLAHLFAHCTVGSHFIILAAFVRIKLKYVYIFDLIAYANRMLSSWVFSLMMPEKNGTKNCEKKKKGGFCESGGMPFFAVVFRDINTLNEYHFLLHRY